MQNILITGADGFIGSHLTEKLVSKGKNITSLVYYNSFNHWGWLEDVNCKNDINVISGDIRDHDFCKKITKNQDVVINLAALIAIPYSYQAPSSYVETNINGTLNLCQAARENSVSQLITISTSEVYGSANYVPIDETHPTKPQSPYSASKIAADAIAMSFFNCFDLPLTIARPFNTYGPRQSARAIIPTIISQILGGSEELKLGDVNPKRDFTYVEDTCEGIASLIGEKKTFGEIINIGSNNEYSIQDIINIIKEIMVKDIKIIRDNQRVRPQKSEVMRLKCDNTKLKELTGFSPSIDIKEGLIRTIKWLSINDNLAKYKSNIYNV